MYVKWGGEPEKPGVEMALSAGQKGTDETVSVMRTMVLGSLTDPAVKAAAMKAVSGVRPMDSAGYVAAVWKAVRDGMGYVPDYFKIEELTSPAIHSRRIMATGHSYGDCDDFSMVGAAWLIALGVPARFEVVASTKNGGKFDHVRVAAWLGNRWVPLETTMKTVPLGRSVPAIRVKAYPI